MGESTIFCSSRMQYYNLEGVVVHFLGFRICNFRQIRPIPIREVKKGGFVTVMTFINYVVIQSH